MKFQPADPSSLPAARLAPFQFAPGLSDAGRAALVRHARPLTFESGQVLLEEGRVCDPLLLVERGSIRVFRRAATGREISLYRVDPGESCVLAISGVLGETPYSASAVVSEDLHGLALPADVFRGVYASEPAMQRFVMDLFGRRLAVLMALVTDIAFERMDQRLAQFLIGEAEKAPGVLAPVHRTHEQIAAELGTAREVVSRLLRSFEERGLVELGRGRVRVLDVDGLRHQS